MDVSEVAVVTVSFKERTGTSGATVYEPIAFANHRFTATAFRWDAFEKEACAVYFGVHDFEYYF